MREKAAIAVALCAALTCGPAAVAQELLVSSFNTDQIKRYDGETGAFIDTFASGGGLDGPLGMVCHTDGDLYVAGFDSNQVHRYDGLSGEFIDVFTSGGDLDEGEGLTFGPDGRLYVAGFDNNAVLRYNGKTGAYIDTFTSGGNLQGPAGVAFGPDGNFYVASFPGDNVLRYDGDSGEFIDVFASGGGLDGTEGILFGPDGNLYAASFNGNQVLRYDGTTGAFIDVFASGGGLSGPVGMIFGPDGNFYVAGWNSSQVHRYDGETGEFIDVFASGGGLNTAAYPAFCNTMGIEVTTGINDAWYNPATAGQGLFIVAYPTIPLIFAAWFTYEVERPDEDVTANLGDPGHRWITAQGPFEGNTAMLDVYVTSGGVFDSVEPKVNDAVKIGTMKIVWKTCNRGTITYDIPDLGLMDEVPIERIAVDNVALCEALAVDP